jgi:hypothetical protein
MRAVSRTPTTSCSLMAAAELTLCGPCRMNLSFNIHLGSSGISYMNDHERFHNLVNAPKL